MVNYFYCFLMLATGVGISVAYFLLLWNLYPEQPTNKYSVQINDETPFVAVQVIPPYADEVWWTIWKENGEKIHATGNIKVQKI